MLDPVSDESLRRLKLGSTLKYEMLKELYPNLTSTYFM
jgi:hypothetical protein